MNSLATQNSQTTVATTGVTMIMLLLGLTLAFALGVNPWLMLAYGLFLGHPVNGEVGTWLAPSGSQICSPFACPYSRLQ